MKTAEKAITTISCCLMGATCFGIALFNFIPTYNFVKTAASTEGVVIEINRGAKFKSVKSTNTRSTYALIIKFKTPDGKNIQFESSPSSQPPESVGQTVPVLYNRTYPQEARIDSFIQFWILPMFFSGLGIFIIGLGAIHFYLVNKT